MSDLKDEYVPRTINNGEERNSIRNRNDLLIIEDTKYILLPEYNLETGDLIRDVRRLSYQAVNIGGKWSYSTKETFLI